MLWVLQDARAQNPNIRIAITLDWGDGSAIERIFSNTKHTDQQNADNFAANLMTYLTTYNLLGFDIDWESPISEDTTQPHFALLVNAIGARFRAQSDKNKHYYLTLSPATVGHLDATAVNTYMDFLNLQIYSGTRPSSYVRAGVNPSLLAYGAKFEADEAGGGPQAPGRQSAKQAYDDNQANYHYSIFTCWRLNSENFVFEQDQQVQLYQMVHIREAKKERMPAAS